MSLWDELRAWSKYLRDNFSVLLLGGLFAGFVLLIVHVSHDGRDAALMSWTTTQATGIIGALLYALTGREKDKRQNQTEDPSAPKPETIDMHVEVPAQTPKKK